MNPHPCRDRMFPSAGGRVSKITDLRRKATEAGRARKWDEAIRLYERICDLEGSNAGYRNELGDIYAKMGDMPQAIVHFEKAVGLYNAVGLNNNAVAVLKKILRYEPNHMESLWKLGETRRKQGLSAEAGTYYLQFLDCSTEVTEPLRERFLDRCAILLEALPGDLDILGRLDQLYEEWSMPAERARIFICKALVAREAGEEDIVQSYVERAQSMVENLDAIPEYQKLFTANSELEPEGAAEMTEEEEAIEEADEKVIEIEVEEDPGFDSGEFSLDLDFDVPEESGTAAPLVTDSKGDTPASSADEDDITGEGVNLLEEILADDEVDLAFSEQSQVDTIQQDLQGQMGSEVDDHDHQGHYELGLVYMDMGMIEQALPSFSKAADGEETRLKALEMKGSCLRKLGRLDEALQAYQEGLSTLGRRPLDYLGLIYEMGACLESMGRIEESLEYFQRVAAIDENFLDVQERLGSFREPN